MKKQNKKTLTLILAILLINIFVFTKAYFNNIENPVDKSDTKEISFTVKKNATLHEVANNLEDKDLIKSSLAFRVYGKLHGTASKLIAGRFILSKSMTPEEIANTLIDSSKSEFIITIQEGLTIKDIDKKLVEMELIKNGEFANAVKTFNGWQYYAFLDKNTLSKFPLPLEGYLYPDTYYLDPSDFKPNDLIYKALDNFEKKWQTAISANGSMLKKYSIPEIIVVASIVEREVFGKNDRKIVAGILWKRLESGWMLGADATLLYEKNDKKITQEDLQKDSPYNTRKIKGLPPTPICNPDIDAISATLNPTNTDYWFYLSAKDGTTIYSKTNEEHSINKAKYL
ncbi:MAG: endolytic transglycosylase MltG [Candidatus Peregrinibacteria bacterium]|nr:endolytic transglycosylase MltG [Candidatus Peregrinibacteria bacterium]